MWWTLGRQSLSALGSDPRVRSVQIFENRGAMMGCSNPHPHGQIWANETVPNEIAKELAAFGDYRHSHSATLLRDYLELELEKRERVVCWNEHFVLLVPFWAVWPFETLLVSRRNVSSLDELTDEERTALAEILRQATDPLRQSVSDFVSLHDGFSPASDRWQSLSGISFSRSFLSTAAALRDGEEVHGWL